MSSEETVSFSLELNVTETRQTVQKLLTILNRSLALLQRMGLPPEATAMIQRIQEMIMWLNRLRLMLMSVQALRMAAGDPLAWAMAGLTAAELGYETGEMIARLS